ncbi:AMP-binding protein [Burkholderia multivorans]|nr:AMP-binding protein [Burkholderia multivorans]
MPDTGRQLRLVIWRRRNMQTSPTLFGELPAYAAIRWPNSRAVTFEGRVFTFEELNECVDIAARALMSSGIGKGDSVGIWLTNRPEFIIAFYAIVKIGAIAVPLNTRYRSDDIRYVVRHAEIKLLFACERSGPVDYMSLLRGAIPGLSDVRFDGSDAYPALRKVVIVEPSNAASPLSWERFLASADRTGCAELDAVASTVQTSDLALMVFTSGTTGNPKGVLHDHRNLRAVCERAASWPLRHGDTVLNFLPMFHLYGLSEIVMATMTQGVHQVLMSVFDAQRALHLIEQERVTGLHGFETHYADLLKHQEALGSDLRTLKFGTLPAGMENSTAVARVVQERMCPTVTGFGISETWAWVCITTLDDPVEQRCATSGRPMPGIEVRIVDPSSGEPLPNGSVGEIVCRGYNVMRGYFKDAEATRASIDPNGWFHSGDRGMFREDGYLQFLGRYKEMLKVGGENVSPAAVEQELLRLVPSIDQVAVVGFPDQRLVEVPVAFVVPKHGMACTLEDVQARCKGHIASFKIPRHVIEMESLPMTASGKVQRTVLKELALRNLAAH